MKKKQIFPASKGFWSIIADGRSKGRARDDAENAGKAFD